MLDMNIIRPGKGSWSSPIVCVPKKGGEIRICVDFRKLNQVNKKDAYPMPNLEEVVGSITKARYFTCLDVKSGYHQIVVQESDREKNAFVTQDGLYEFNVLPFGLCNAPATFQRLMNKILAPVLGDRVVVYLDDILIYSYDYEEHLATLARVIFLLKKAGIKLNMRKCMFGLRELTFLGYRNSQNTMRPDPEKVKAILEMPAPRNKEEAQSVMGMFNFYRKFIEHCSQKAAPITDLFKTKENNKSFEWTELQANAYEELKFCLANTAELILYDPQKETELTYSACICS